MKILNKYNIPTTIALLINLLTTPVLMHAANIAVDQESDDKERQVKRRRITTDPLFETEITPEQRAYFQSLVIENNYPELENLFAQLSQEQKNLLLTAPIANSEKLDTPLHYAARHGHLELAQLFINHSTIHIF